MQCSSAIILLIIILSQIFPSMAWCEIFWIAPAPTGSDSNLGSSSAPWATFGKAFTVMAGGDTLVVKDGNYAQKIIEPPSGTAGNPTVIRAENDGSAVVDAFGVSGCSGGHCTCLNLNTSNYVNVEGLLLKNGTSDGVVWIAGHHNQILRVGIKGDPTYNYSFQEGISIGGDNNILQDIWVWGGGRYLIDIGGQYNIVRRAVLRWDAFLKGDQPTGGLAWYDGKNNISENILMLDFNAPPDPNKAYGGIYCKGSAANNNIYGTIALNFTSGWMATYFLSEWDNGSNIHNSVSWDASGTGIRYGSKGGTADQVTIKGATSIGSVSYGTSMVISNSVFSDSGGLSGVTPSYNIYYNTPNAGGTGALTYDPLVKYIPRIEANSPAYQTGENGKNRGANILKRYENGVETTTNLWPWPYESRIKAEICSGETRGWCGTNKTLTTYVWEYLGNTIPAEMYGVTQDITVPTVPENLTASVVSSSQINLVWTASTDPDDAVSYIIYRDGVQIGESVTNIFSNTGLNPNTLYSYTVVAKDTHGNVSVASPVIYATTQVGTTNSCIPSYYIKCVGGNFSEYTNIQAAANAAVAGDIVLVFTGNYVGFTAVNAGVTYKANDNLVVINTDGPTGDSVYIPNITDITIDGFTMVNPSGRCVSAREATANSPHRRLTIKNNICIGAGLEGMYLSQVADSLVDNNIISGSGVSGLTQGHGIYLANAGSNNTIIRGNTIYGMYSSGGAEGIQLNGDVSQGGDGLIKNAIIERNVIYNTPNNGIYFDGVQDTVVQNNLLYNIAKNGIRGGAIDGAAGMKNIKILNNTIVIPSIGLGADIKFSEDLGGHEIINNILINEASGYSMSLASSNFTSDYNITFGGFTRDGEQTIQTLTQWKALGYDTHSFSSTGANLFINSSTNFKLKTSSPAIDAGFSLTGVQTDFEGNSRPQGTRFDIGAFEYTPTGGGGGTFNPNPPTNLRVY